jgi:hypothetical protein
MKKLVITLLQKTKLFFALAMLLTLCMVVLYVCATLLINKKTVSYTTIFQDTQAQTDAFYAISKQKKLVNNTADLRNQLSSYFINQGSVSNFFEKLEEVAEETNVEFSIISARIGQADEDGLRVQMSAEGTFRNVYHFFTLLETLPFGINVINFDMHANEISDASVETRQPWRGVFDVEVVTYIE